MSEEDKDSKSEDPTEKKISDTLEKGNVPFSKEVTNVFSVTAITLVAIFYAPRFGYEITIAGKSVFGNISDWPLGTGEDVINLGSYLIKTVSLLILPIIIPILLFGVAAALIQNRPRIVFDRIQPKFERISLSKGLKRLFGTHGLKEFAKSMSKFSIAGLTTTIIIMYQMEWVVSHLLIETVRLPYAILQLTIQAGIGVSLMMVILGAVDFVWVRREWFNNIKMSHQEVKDERKQAEGDPMIKVRSQSIARDRARNKMMSSVPDATIVVANPTHFSVALRYDPARDHAPYVLAKGQNRIALKIREIAEENEIPIIEDKPLARSLHKACSVNHEIPVEFYVPIAEIIRTLSKDPLTKTS